MKFDPTLVLIGATLLNTLLLGLVVVLLERVKKLLAALAEEPVAPSAYNPFSMLHHPDIVQSTPTDTLHEMAGGELPPDWTVQHPSINVTDVGQVFVDANALPHSSEVAKRLEADSQAAMVAWRAGEALGLSGADLVKYVSEHK